jgi:hypothetical protein
LLHLTKASFQTIREDIDPKRRHEAEKIEKMMQLKKEIEKHA